MEDDKKETQNQNIASVAVMKKRILIKGTLLIATLALLVVLAIVGTVGWYTKVSSVDALTMDVAEFDFTANYVDEIFVVNTASYTNIDNFKVAPGSSGVIPILLKAENSDTSVDYTLTIDTTNTAPEMQRRIRYYYYRNDDNSPNPAQITLQPGSPTPTGSIPAHGSVTEYIYWEWVYDLNPNMFFYNGQWRNSGLSGQTLRTLEGFPSGINESTMLTQAQDDFNELDTQIGLGHLDERFVSYKDGINRDGTDTQEKRGSSDVFEIYTAETTTLTAISGGAVKSTTMTAVQKAMQAVISIKGTQGRPTDAAVQFNGVTKFIEK